MAWGASDAISFVSALAAIASAIYAGKTYTATVELKKHDSALRLRLANETLRATVLPLLDLLERARRSRQAVCAATGRSGAMQAWEQRAMQLETEISALRQHLPVEDKQSSHSLEDLTNLIAATHGFQQRASAVLDELTESLRQDDREREHIREDHRATMAALLAPRSRS